MTTDRPYRKGLTLEMAVEEIRRGGGTQFDPELADAFAAMVERAAAEEARGEAA
jgi:HD-GYP domain-containing protein (c-di-GMP phosphodiesterase class II)